MTKLELLSKEYSQYKLSNKIYKRLCNNLSKNKKGNYEIRNILERLMLCLHNINYNKDTKYSIYRKIDFRNTCIKKLFIEFKEKQKYLKRKVTKLDIKKYILDEIVKFYKEEEIEIFDRVKIQYIENKIVFKDIIVRVNPLILTNIKKRKDIDIALMITRYNTILSRGQQWGIPLEQYNNLYKNYGIKNEGFASPLNSRMSIYKDGKFCSLFYDTDKPFGSLGSYFDVEMLYKDNIGWTVNPPYVDFILVKSAKKIIKTVNKAIKLNKRIMIYYIMPGWFDSEAYTLLNNYKNTKYMEILKEKTYFYEYGGKNIVGVFKSIVFVLDSYKEIVDYSNINDGMKLYKQNNKKYKKYKK